MAKKSAPKTKKLTTNIPKEQLSMPVSFDPAGNLVTLQEVINSGHVSVASLATLSPEKRAELTVKRIEAQPEFDVAMIGGGIVDRERAIKEVEAHSDVGRVLVEIEQRVVQNLLEEVAKR